MENINLDQENNLLGDYYFKISYKSQKYKKSQEYQNWLKTMQEKYGLNGKEIFCDKDNAIIYTIHNDNDTKITCPICNSDLYNCIFCNKTQNKRSHKCCIKAYFKYCIKDHFKTRYIEIENNNKEFFKRIILFSFFPLFPLFFLIFAMFDLLYFNMIEDKDKEYEEKDNNIFIIIIFLFIFVTTINYAIIYYLLYLVVFIISLPFKLLLIKMYYGVLDVMMDDELDM